MSRETTHTPQGDENTFYIYYIIFLIETTPTPQGDGNFCASYIRISLMETTYTPLGAKIQTKERETR